VPARTVAGFSAPAGTELVEVIGNGSVFQVARVRRADVLCICKRLTPRNRREPAARAALAREATSLGMTELAVVPRIHEVGTDGHGPFLLESHMPGVSLRALVERWNERESTVPGPLAHHVALAAVRALSDLHDSTFEGRPAELSHGDVSPDNLLLDPYGEVCFIDFGGARFRGMKPELETQDRGTLPYVAPEVARGDARPDQAADVYALAATLVFVFLGRAPCATAEEAAMLVAVGERGVPEDIFGDERLTPRIADALRAALRLERTARTTDARALERMLSSC